MTPNTSAVAVCCSSDCLNSLSSRAFSMAMTAWAAKFVTSAIRVNVQLVDAETGNHIWAERFDKPVTDLFDMQDEIVSRLANTLNAQLIAAEAHRTERSPHPDSAAKV
jgi:hypothetical protein